tara:strand:+ start:12 stop:542 length:531 start_codon:yes stop_codon:yes gene_type:complete
MNTIKEKINSKKIKDLTVIKLDTFEDFRGEIWTIYSRDHSDTKYVTDKVTISKFGVLRGFHGDPFTSKLITCLSGKFQFAIVDVRKESETYGNIEVFVISDDEPTVIFVPAGCVNAHLSLSDRCVFYYKWSEDYNGPESQVTVAWNDPDLGVNWIVKNPILSERDKNGVSYKEVRL